MKNENKPIFLKPVLFDPLLQFLSILWKQPPFRPPWALRSYTTGFFSGIIDRCLSAKGLFDPPMYNVHINLQVCSKICFPSVTRWQSENSPYTEAHFAYANLHVAPYMSTHSDKREDMERHSAISDTLTKWKFVLHWSTFCIRQFIRRARYVSAFR